MSIVELEETAGPAAATLIERIEADVARSHYYGAVITVAKGGSPLYHKAIGWADGAHETPLTLDSVFSIFSITKAFTNVLILRAIERGQLTLTGRVSQILPEFDGPPRDRITLYHLLTHTSGLPGVWEVGPDASLEKLSELFEATCKNVHGVVPPGTRCDYSPIANHVLMAELLQRTDPKGRGFRQIMHEDLFETLDMTETGLGVRDDQHARRVIPDMRGTLPISMQGSTNKSRFGFFEEPCNEAPHVGAATTIGDFWKFTEMLRRGGLTLEGKRFLSPRILKVARQNQTGLMENELYRAVALRAGWTPPPAYIGLGFSLRGEKLVHHQFGTMTTPETFGNYGAGSSVFWIDPEQDLTFTGFTAGLLSQAANIERFQYLSDIAIGSFSAAE